MRGVSPFALLFAFCVSADAQPQPKPTRPAFTGAQNLATDSICAKGADSTLFLDGTLKTVTVVTGSDTSLPNSGTWTTTGGAGTGASGTFTATAGNLSTVTIVAKGSGYTSNPTWVPSSGAKGTSTIAFSGCANQADGTAETAFTTTVTIPASTLSQTTIPLSLTYVLITSAGQPTLAMKLRYGTISGTQIFSNVNSLSTTSALSVTGILRCILFAASASSATNKVGLGCSNAATLGQGTVNATGGFTLTSLNTTVSTPITITVIWGANTAGNALALTAISPF